MAKVSIANVEVLSPEAPFNSAYSFRITFDANEELPEDLEWKVTYVGCAESNDYDQVLDSVLVGPVPCGRHVFVFDAPAPDPARIPSGELIGVTVVLLTCAYREQEFVRIGYFVRVEYDDAEMRENPPAQPVYERLMRVILADSPRVTRLTINWSGDAVNEAPDLAQEGTSTSGAAANEEIEAGTSAHDDEAASVSASASASASAGANAVPAANTQEIDSSQTQEAESRTNETETPVQNGDAEPEADKKQENGSAEQSQDQETTKRSENDSPAGDKELDGLAKKRVAESEADENDDAALKRAKMDEANANGNANGLNSPVAAAGN